jgi:ribosomal protein L33
MKNRTVPFFSKRKWDVSLFNFKPYNIRVSEAECEISLVAHYFRSSNGFTPQKRLFLAKFSPLQNLKVAIYKGFVILGRQK